MVTKTQVIRDEINFLVKSSQKIFEMKNQVEDRILAVKLRCRHKVAEYEYGPGWGAFCIHCDAYLGWYCPDNKNFQCEYKEEVFVLKKDKGGSFTDKDYKCKHCKRSSNTEIRNKK